MSVDVENLRPAFEAWARENGFEHFDGEFGGPGKQDWWYWNDLTTGAWEVWVEKNSPVAAPELDVEAERREFEAWAVRKRAPYCDSPADRAQQWAGWQGRASSAAQGTAPAPAKPWPQVNAEAIAAQDLLDWNRSQGKRPIEITKELGVARKAFEFLAAAKVITAAQQANQAAPVSTEQAGDAWISVEDRLPEVETDVLVRGKRGDSVCHEVAGLFGGEWMGQNTEMELRFIVHHWMPLPAAPSPNNSPVGADRRE